VLIGAVAAVVLLIAAGVFAVVKFSGDDKQTATDRPSPTATPSGPPPPPPNTGPFTGVYRANFGPILGFDGSPGPDPALATDTFAVRSVCRPTGCVATAQQTSGGEAFDSPVVFDELGQEWLAVGLGSIACQGDPAAEMWEVMRLTPRPDGTLAGEYEATTNNLCSKSRTVTFTRTGDVDLESLPDPVSVPPRVVSPAEALRGKYHQTRTFPAVGQKQDVDFAVTTDCLRAGDRCMSYFYAQSGAVLPLVFGSDQWTLSTESQSACRGAQIQATKTGQYPLPQPLQNPITTLTGNGRQEQTAPCQANIAFDDAFTRTGD
jgi:serine/threonine-protein kinase